jgi:hypothetical protein
MTPEILTSDAARLTLFRSAPTWDGKRTAAVGKFSCQTAEAGAELLQQAADTLRGEGFAAVLGPMDGTTWNSYRLVIETDGSAPFLMEPQSGASDAAAFERAGFQRISEYFSSRVALAAIDMDAPAADDNLQITPWDGTDPEGHFASVHELSCAAFAQNAYYTPISREAFLGMYMPFVPMLIPDLVLFARNREAKLVGFLFGTPDFAAGPRPDAVILKTYASLQQGAGRALSARFHATARDLGFASAIHALIHDDNQSAARSRLHGAVEFRRYALMGRRLDG